MPEGGKEIVENIDGQETEERTVPVSEAIRYRKRAQAAEKELETYKTRFEESESERKRLEENLTSSKIEQELSGRLSAAGVVDLSGALVLALSEMEKEDIKTADEAVAKLRKEKEYLFHGSKCVSGFPSRTEGVRGRETGSRTVIAKKAEKAARSGKRGDVHAYMRAKRGSM